MNGSEKIVNAIIADALSYADGVAVKSAENSSATVSAAEKDAENHLSAVKEEAEKASLQIIKNKRTLLNLEKRKITLKARREVLDGVYAAAYEKLKSADKKTRLKILESIAEKHAEEGQTFIVSEKSDITVKEVESLAAVKKLGLIVKKTGDFDGGAVLSGSAFDERFTYADLIEELREATESEISGKLFENV